MSIPIHLAIRRAAVRGSGCVLCRWLAGLTLAALLGQGAVAADPTDTTAAYDAAKASVATTAPSPPSATPGGAGLSRAKGKPAAHRPTQSPTQSPNRKSNPADGVPPDAAKSSNGARSGKAQDRIDLDATQITGNKELPKVMYVVPWKRPDLGDYAGRPPNSLLDEVLQPVDRDVFRRQNRYYSALQPDSAAAKGGGGAAPAPAAAAEAMGKESGDAGTVGEAPKAPSTESAGRVEK